MNKKIKLLITGFVCLLSMNGIASSCSKASPVTSPEFCSSFKMAAECHCVSSGLPNGMCKNERLLYKRMIDTFGSLVKACQYQRDTSTQECIDDWNCYLSGGLTSNSEYCSGTGASCV